MSATRTHHREKAPERKSRKAKPERDPMEGEEAEEAEGSERNKATNLWGVDGIEVEVFDFGSNQG